MSFHPDHSYAFVMSPRLGDSLLSMIVVHNLRRNGYQVKVFSNQIHALRQWFPGFDIERAPASAAIAREQLAEFDVILHAYAADVLTPTGSVPGKVVVMDEWPVYRQVKNMVDIQMELCKQRFYIDHPVKGNGMQVPTGTRIRSDERSVIIHPVASDRQKSWRPMRFVKIAKALRRLGYDPEFLLPPEQLSQWRWLEAYGFTPHAYANLGMVAARIAEAGWVVGNDSGIGHLASNIGVPTVSLAMRRSIARRWRPGWAPSYAVIPPPVVPGRFFKEMCWKYLLSANRVMAAFYALQADYGVGQRGTTPSPSGSARVFGTRSKGAHGLGQDDGAADVRHAG